MFRNHTLLTSIALATLTLALPAQWKTIENRDLGVSYRMPSKQLQVVPQNKGRAPTANLVDRWDAIKPIYSGDRRYTWNIRVYAFEPKGPITGDGSAKKDDAADPKDPKEAARRAREAMIRAMMRGRSYETFAQWVDKSWGNVDVTMRGKKRKQRSGARLPYARWEFLTSNGTWQHVAASYKVGRQEVVIIGQYPTSLRKKLRKTVDASIESLKLFDASKTTAKKRTVRGEKFVVVKGDKGFTRLRRKLLDDALKGIERTPGWDLFCTKNYIVLYSFDDKKHQKSRSFAIDLANKMDEMNRQYRKRFPPHENVKKWWSVLRICRNKAEFDRYGGTSGGVIGWFNPRSKELVVFNAKKLGLFKTDVVAFHEGWHQYANFWFPGAKLHRWFGEGMGDFFGSMKRLGKNKWVNASSKMRKETIRRLVRQERTVPLKDIVRWHMAKFYGPRATDYYAQGWAMIDFFERGPKSPYWKKEWSKILPTYIRVALETKDTEKAVTQAYAGVDWDELEEAFKNYVKRSL